MYLMNFIRNKESKRVPFKLHAKNDFSRGPVVFSLFRDSPVYLFAQSMVLQDTLNVKKETAEMTS